MSTSSTPSTVQRRPGASLPQALLAASSFLQTSGSSFLAQHVLRQKECLLGDSYTNSQACFIAHLLGFGCLLPGARGFRNWLRQRTHIAEMPARQDIMEFVDPILEKIHAEGLQRLSGSERRILQKARQKARRKV